MIALWQIMALVFAIKSFAVDVVVTPALLTAVFAGLKEMNGVEIQGLKCMVDPGPADPSQTIEPVCLQLAAFPRGELKMRNCVDAFRRVENKDALRWTLEYFVRNQGGIKDPSCFLDNHEIDGLMVAGKKGKRVKAKVGSEAWEAAAREKGISTVRFGETFPIREEWAQMAKKRGVEVKDLKRDIASKGIENGCQIMMNDFSRACDPSPKGPFGYWIDLCANEGNAVRPLVDVKLSTGTCENDFRDEINKRTTIPGAFVTGMQSIYRPSDKVKKSVKQMYKAMEKKDLAQKVVVFGLNESNNDSFWDKHVHTTPLITSSGCPAIDAEDVDIIYEMSKAQTLVVNYGPERFHRPGNSCRNLREEDR